MNIGQVMGESAIIAGSQLAVLSCMFDNVARLKALLLRRCPIMKVLFGKKTRSIKCGAKMQRIWERDHSLFFTIRLAMYLRNSWCRPILRIVFSCNFHYHFSFFLIATVLSE